MKNFFAFLLSILLYHGALSQQLTFIKNYLFADLFGESIPLADGSYATICHHHVSLKPLIIKSNSFGDTLWTKSYFTFSINSGPVGIVEKPNGGFYFSFDYSVPNSSDYFGRVVSVSSSGDLIWYNDYDSVSFLKIYSAGNDVLLLGRHAPGNMIAIQIDSGGNTVSQTNVPPIPNEGVTFFGKQNNNFYIGTAGQDSAYYARVYKLDLSGNVIWSFKVDSVATFFWDLGVTANNDLFAVLTKRNESLQKDVLHVYHLSSSGTLIWENPYLEYAKNVEVNKIAVSQSGNLAVTGMERDTGVGCCGPVLFLLIDSTGNQIGHNLFPEAFNGYSIYATPDSGFIIAADDINPAGIAPGFFLIKTNEMGEVSGGTELPSKDKELKIFPNPSTGMVSIHIIGKENPAMDFQVFNSLGQGIQKFSASKSSIELDLSSYPEGIYFLIRKEEFKSYLGKVIISR